MLKIPAWGAVIAFGLVFGARAQPAADACANLTALKLGHVTITEARLIATGSGTEPAASAFCKVLGTAKPTSDSDIRFEVVIPEGRAWNGRYLQVGNGGFAGVIPEGSMMMALGDGYAVAGTDDGHQAESDSGARWALGHPEKQIDYGYRALKETTDAAKAIIRAYAGSEPKFSYFQGCSDGGREAMMEAQRYPEDFNGIIAGDPANNWTHLMANTAWNFQAMTATRGSFLPPDTLKAIEAEAIRQCGDADGVIEDPLSCHFRPEAIRCTAGDAPSCLTDAQLATLAKIYGGARNPRTGEQIMSGFSPGGESEDDGWLQWMTGAAPGDKRVFATQFGSNFFRYVVFADSYYDIRDLNFDSDIAHTDGQFAKVFNSYDPDLSAFRSHGGKLIHYDGWADPAIPPLDSINYYNLVQARMGPTSDFYRLFMAPGMLHCGGGPGPNVISTMPAITAWVEQGKAPETLIATKYGDANSASGERTRPLCPFPARAKWDGKGDKSNLESYRCMAPNP